MFLHKNSFIKRTLSHDLQYQGIWYDMESYPQEFQDGTCPTAQYTLNGGIVNVLNTQVRGQTLDTIEATAVLAGNPSEAKLIVTFPVAGTDCKKYFFFFS